MISRDKWSLLADQFPPTLVTNSPETSLKPNETPSCTGISATAEGYITGGTIPTATTRIAKTYTISATSYSWYYNRLWYLSGANLVIGAPEYTAYYYKQGTGEIDFNDDAESLLLMLPIGDTGLIVFKSTGAYIIPNANDRQGNFQTTALIQEAKITTATHAIELDGVVYFANTSGLYSIDIQGKVEELSFPIRGTITPAAVTADFRNKFIIVGATHAYDVPNKRWFNYSGTTFTYETPRTRNDDGSAFAADRVAFELKWASTAAEDDLEEIVFQTRVEDREWSNDYTAQVSNARGQHVRVEVPVEGDTGRDFKVKVTTLPSTLSIKRILVRSDKYSTESRDS